MEIHQIQQYILNIQVSVHDSRNSLIHKNTVLAPIAYVCYSCAHHGDCCGRVFTSLTDQHLA